MINGSDQNYSVEYERFVILLFKKLPCTWLFKTNGRKINNFLLLWSKLLMNKYAWGKVFILYDNYINT